MSSRPSRTSATAGRKPSKNERRRTRRNKRRRLDVAVGVSQINAAKKQDALQRHKAEKEQKEKYVQASVEPYSDEDSGDEDSYIDPAIKDLVLGGQAEDPCDFSDNGQDEADSDEGEDLVGPTVVDGADGAATVAIVNKVASSIMDDDDESVIPGVGCQSYTRLVFVVCEIVAPGQKEPRCQCPYDGAHNRKPIDQETLDSKPNHRQASDLTLDQKMVAGAWFQTIFMQNILDGQCLWRTKRSLYAQSQPAPSPRLLPIIGTRAMRRSSTSLAPTSSPSVYVTSFGNFKKTLHKNRAARIKAVITEAEEARVRHAAWVKWRANQLKLEPVDVMGVWGNVLPGEDCEDPVLQESIRELVPADVGDAWKAHKGYSKLPQGPLTLLVQWRAVLLGGFRRESDKEGGGSVAMVTEWRSRIFDYDQILAHFLRLGIDIAIQKQSSRLDAWTARRAEGSPRTQGATTASEWRCRFRDAESGRGSDRSRKCGCATPTALHCTRSVNGPWGSFEYPLCAFHASPKLVAEVYNENAERPIEWSSKIADLS
ncbi:BZ3500_MvSof-1268-A1-R1_Chr11-1g03253 [Microbotryum saponariae]|uniref:BZ3500_MvSof-1268-A1-R1_Chr11-1g03253 protein n=1 Tax=Microbotryum saponariae TaxID=289078 RepID=A0A2X0NEL7_9BASI|nr:BZ3501_MvSof-1269-A2-R1_Chr11g02828 [Microbotryum saponariae]SDA03816.1 BZ3500_MvSof-1268-A1-R1_Chr11-1g03253 [Microbotryum saponariae]